MKFKTNTTRKLQVIIEINNQNPEKAKKDLIFTLKSLDIKVLDIKNVRETRTQTQNAALHLWFQLLAEALNEKHFDMRAIIRKDIEMPWSGYAVKEYLFKPLLNQQFGKKSTTQLFRSKEIDLLFDIINRTIIERTGGEVSSPPFPCKEELENQAIKMLNN